ncbi:MAG: transcription termination/antitermination protein NusA, partial [Alphaproteobacteria bacterium]|nr:transcription termination/antitermination protein NusA [Alphaproteobacteria bacterium]
MSNQVIYGSVELLQIAEAVAREKNIDRETVILAMEDAIAIAARKKYGAERNIKVDINRKLGDIKITRITDVVELVENEMQQINLADAQARDKNLKIGDQIIDDLPPID